MTEISHKWTEAEDQILIAAVDQSATPIDWLWIASCLSGRSNKDCRKRWYQKFAGNNNIGSWMDAEDDRLRAAVAQYGTKWPVVSKQVETRTSDQCSKRWKQVLDPNLDHSPWSLGEDNCLLIGVEQHGRNWKVLSELYFKNRAALSLKNRHALLIRRKNRPKRSPRSLSGSRSHSPNVIAMSEHRDSQQQPGNLATFSDVNSSFNNEIQNEIMANDVNRNDSFDEETRHYGGVPEATTSDAMLGKDDLWPTDAELFSSYSPFQGSTINEDLNLGNMLEESSWSPQSVKQLHKCTTMPELQDNFECLLGSMSPFGNFPTYPNTSLDSKETSPGISVGICSQFSNSPGNIPMAAATESENEQWSNPTVLCSGKDWTNLFNLSFRCTKKKMEAIRQSVFEATNDALCFEEKDEDVVEMRLRVELRS